MSTPALRRGVVVALRSLQEISEVGSDRPAPEGQYPYIQIGWDITTGEALAGDGRSLWARNDIQFSLWEKEADETGSVARSLVAALNGAKFDGQRLRFSSATRVADPDGFDLVHTAFTFTHRSPF